ncbi:MAG: hypothetical protein ABR551_05305 [Gemmatimonadales bacterium]
MRRSRTFMMASGTLLGLAAGWLVAQGRQSHHRADLFNDRPIRRFAALGFLAGQQSVDTLCLLRDYLTWETVPLLRRRADTIVRKLEARLG